MIDALTGYVGILLAGAGLLAAFGYRYFMHEYPCYGDHSFEEYSTTGDYRVVGEPTLNILPRHRCDVYLYEEFSAQCDEFGCRERDTEWRLTNEAMADIESLEELPNIIIQD
jgi:hypothetical protein